MRDLEPEFEALHDVGDALQHCEILALNPGHNGTCYILARKINSTDAPINDPYLTRSNLQVRVLEVSEHAVAVFDLWGVNPHVDFVQPLPDRRFLVGWSRTRYSQSRGEYEPNALVVTDQGEQIASFSLGDGIEDVQATKDGAFWVSYFDEGISGPPRRSGSGRRGWLSALVKWSLDGQILYEYPPEILDCYAINLESDSSLWACYYTDFPLVNIVGTEIVREFPATACGAKLFAVTRRGVLFGIGYGAADEPGSQGPRQVRSITTGKGPKWTGDGRLTEASQSQTTEERLRYWSEIWSLYRFADDGLQLVERFRLPRGEHADEFHAARGPFVFWLRDGMLRRLNMDRLFGRT